MDIPQERVVTEIPGPRSREWFERRAAACPRACSTRTRSSRLGLRARSSDGVDGNRLIDFATGIAVLNVGHTSPEVVAAAQRRLELDTHSCFVTANEPYIELAERLDALAPGDAPKKTMFANSGAEAVENAVKIARRATGRQAIVTFDHAFRPTLLAMSLGQGHAVQAGDGAVRTGYTGCPSPTRTGGRAAPSGAPSRRSTTHGRRSTSTSARTTWPR